jgi:hypothetical protein
MFQQMDLFFSVERERRRFTFGVLNRTVSSYWTKPRNQLLVRPVNCTHYNVGVLSIKTL